MNISTDEDPAIVHVRTDDRSYTTPVSFDLERSKVNVLLHVENDSDEVQNVVKSQSNLFFRM